MPIGSRIVRHLAFAAALALAAPAVAQVPLADGSWSTAAPLPEARMEVSVATDGDRIYLAGGFAAGGSAFGISAPRAVYAYSPATDAWTLLATLPEGVNHAGMAYLDGRLYVVGGYRETSTQPIADMRVYDIAADSWSAGPMLPTARGALAVTVHDGRIHAIGGVTFGGRNTGAHEIFDPATGAWTAAAPLPTPRNHHAAASAGGVIVVLVGREGADYRMTVNEIYDPATDTWRRGADVPTGRSGVAVAVLDGEIYLFGGETQNPGATFNQAERYDPATDSWAALPPMPTARHGLGAAVLGGRIHVVSGGPGAGLSYSAVHEVLTPAPSARQAGAEG